MTTLQLAALVARNARAATEADAARVVLETLHAQRAWFCRSYETVEGHDVEAPMPRVLFVTPPPRLPLEP